MLEGYLRPKYEALLIEPVAYRVGYFLSPNAITLISCSVGLLSAVAVAAQHPFLAFALLLFSGYLDTLDGTVARLTGRSSPFGAMLDIFCDRIVEGAMILAFFLIDPSGRALLCLLMLGSLLLVVTSFLVGGLFMPNTTRKSYNYTPGLIERPEMFVFFALMMFFPTAFTSIASAFILLVLYTTVLRLRRIYKLLPKINSESI